MILRVPSGLQPRIGSPMIEDMQWMADTVNSDANGYTMCTGFTARVLTNDLVNGDSDLWSADYFLHLRSTTCAKKTRILSMKRRIWPVMWICIM